MTLETPLSTRRAAFVLGLFDTGLAAVRALGRARVPVYGFDASPSEFGFHSRYGSHALCPDPVSEPHELVRFLLDRARQCAEPPILYPTSDAFVVAPGGIGTVLELAMIWQLLQVKHLHDTPLILVGKMWGGLVEWAKTHLLATEPEMQEGHYTGAVTGTPCFQHGKVERLQQWLTDHDEDLQGSWFYSDSHNDLPLLSRVDNPVAVDPDDTLAAHAREQRWPIISLRAPGTAPS